LEEKANMEKKYRFEEIDYNMIWRADIFFAVV